MYHPSTRRLLHRSCLRFSCRRPFLLSGVIHISNNHHLTHWSYCWFQPRIIREPKQNKKKSLILWLSLYWAFGYLTITNNLFHGPFSVFIGDFIVDDHRQMRSYNLHVFSFDDDHQQWSCQWRHEMIPRANYSQR